MTDTVQTARITTLAGALALVGTAIASQNDITVVSNEIERIKGEGAPKGSRVHLVLSGAGVGDPTRRYFLRNNSAFSSLIEEVGLFMGSPKKARGDDNYHLYFGLTEELATWQPAPPPKAEKVKMSKEDQAAARQAGKAAARARRAAEAAAAAEGQTVTA